MQMLAAQLTEALGEHRRDIATQLWQHRDVSASMQQMALRAEEAASAAQRQAQDTHQALAGLAPQAGHRLDHEEDAQYFAADLAALRPSLQNIDQEQQARSEAVRDFTVSRAEAVAHQSAVEATEQLMSGLHNDLLQRFNERDRNSAVQDLFGRLELAESRVATSFGEVQAQLAQLHRAREISAQQPTVAPPDTSLVEALGQMQAQQAQIARDMLNVSHNMELVQRQFHEDKLVAKVERETASARRSSAPGESIERPPRL